MLDLKELESQVRTIRLRLDTIDKLIFNYLGNVSREVSTARTSVQRSKMWLGRCLKEIGTSNPYPESKNPANTKIEPTAESVKLEEVGFPDEIKGYIERVKYLRNELAEIEAWIIGVHQKVVACGIAFFTAFNQTYISVIDTQNWLGMELGRIRDEQLSKAENPVTNV